MQFGMIVPYYISWHYTRAIRDIVEHSKDFLWFFWNLFSIPELLRTFFAPFERLGQTAPKRFDPQKMLEALATNMVMRVIGMVVRGFFIAVGLTALVCVLLVCVAFVCIWIVLPFIVSGMLVAGMLSLFS